MGSGDRRNVTPALSDDPKRVANETNVQRVMVTDIVAIDLNRERPAG
jgi:hypothetical protein